MSGLFACPKCGERPYFNRGEFTSDCRCTFADLVGVLGPGRHLTTGEQCPSCGWVGTHLANCVENPDAVWREGEL